MATAAELESQITKQQADYLARLERAGQLPTVISEAWQKAGGAETAKLRGEEAELLKGYVSAGAEAREKYKDVWDPFARDVLASKQVELKYAPIADIRKELAMRAEALGVATQSATAMYGAETERAQTGLGFAQSAYERAWAREQEAQRQREQQEEMKHKYTAPAKNDREAVTEKKLETAITGDLRDAVSKGYGGKQIAIHGEEMSDPDEYMTREQFIAKLAQTYPDINTDWIADQVYNSYFRG